VGADGLRLIYFHLEFVLINFVLLLITFLTCFCFVLVGFVLEIQKFFLAMKSYILFWYCAVGSMTIVLSLSADVRIAPLFLSLVLIVFMLFHSV
jgi:hypothetical protein